MNEEKTCRKCLLRDAFPEDYEKYVAGLLKNISSGQRTPEEIYQRRLDICRMCSQLQNGTCMGCGCLVELKAAYRREHCPFRMWQNGQ